MKHATVERAEVDKIKKNEIDKTGGASNIKYLT